MHDLRSYSKKCVFYIDSDFNKTIMTFEEPALFTPPGAFEDSVPELNEGFIYFLEVDRANSDSRDYSRLQFLNRNILAVIQDNDGMIKTGLKRFAEIIYHCKIDNHVVGWDS